VGLHTSIPALNHLRDLRAELHDLEEPHKSEVEADRSESGLPGLFTEVGR
jgi:hypothetical protein